MLDVDSGGSAEPFLNSQSGDETKSGRHRKYHNRQRADLIRLWRYEEIEHQVTELACESATVWKNLLEMLMDFALIRASLAIEEWSEKIEKV